MWIVVILALVMNLLSLTQGMLKEISFKLVENCSIGTIVGNIKLSADLYVFKQIELRLENSEYFEEINSISQNRFGKHMKTLFKINNSTGDMVTASEIDRETLCHSNILKRIENCTVLQIISVNKLRWININIEIIDINDNAPTFRLNRLSVAISEISKVNSSIILEEPIDLDSEQFRPIHYRIHSSFPFPNVFNLSRDPLKLTLNQPLDYETTKQYLLVLFACDTGSPPLCGNQTIAINITNENDESPMFERSNYTAIINEDTPTGQAVVWPTAFDKDEGEFGKLEYSFSSGYDEVKKYFSIDRNSGKITIIKKFSYPTKFKFSIEAIDKASNPLIGRTWIILHVVDVNNNSPVILVNPIDSFLISKFHNHTTIEITENNKIPFQLAFITVSDLDQGENARCSCQIQSVTSIEHLKYFKMINVIEMSERSIFKLLAEKSFDAEEIRYFSITILCVDHGEPQNSASTKIEINIKDENEYPPVFDQNIYEIYIKENSLPGTNVKNIKVYDRDLTQSKIFDLTAPGSTFFTINSSGILYTNVILDYEKHQKMSFHVLAINRGIRSFTSSARVWVVVLDVNDNAPQFSVASNKFEVPENMKGRYEIGKISAFDKDSEKNSKLNYYLLNATTENTQQLNDSQIFELNNETGVIYSNVSLDYEKCDMYIITVKIVDNGEPPLSNIQKFFIHVLDINDNGPIWQYPKVGDNVMNISIQNIRDLFLTRVRAVDNDSDKYNVVNYYLLSHNDVFTINQLTGVITFKSLNVKPGQMTLHLQAVDANSRFIHSSHTLVVYITDDEKPYLQISLSSSLTFPVMISIIAISSLLSVVLVIFVFYFCYRKRCLYRNCSQFSAANTCRNDDKTNDVKFHKEPKKTFDIPLDLVTDNETFNQNIIEDSMKLILDPLYSTTSSASNPFHDTDTNPKLKSLFCKIQPDSIYQDVVRQGYTDDYNDQKRNLLHLQTNMSSLQSAINPHNEFCVLHTIPSKDKHSPYDTLKPRFSSTVKKFDSNDAIIDSYATFLNCSCSNVPTSEYDNSLPSSKLLTAPFVFNGSAWIPNTSLTNENVILQNKKDFSKQQPLKSIMKKTSTSFVNVDSSSSSGQCNDTDQASSIHDSGCIVGYPDSSCLPPKSISLLDNTYQCKKSQV